MRIVETGGTGLMGRELQKIMDIEPLTHQDIEIRDPESTRRALEGVGLVLHLAAYTDVFKAQTDRWNAYQTNVIGSRNVSRRAPTLYVSTDYVFDGEKGNYSERDYTNPINYYGLTKLLGEYEVLRNGGKVLRLSFKPRPYKHPRVPTGAFFSGGYVDDMAKEVKWAVENFDRLPDITNVGIERVSLFTLASQTRQVERMKIEEIPMPIPLDTSLNLKLWRRLKCQND